MADDYEDRATYVTRNCQACYHPITVRLVDFQRGWGKFCNKSCAGAYRLGARPEHVDRGKDHSDWAEAALDRKLASGLGVGDTWPKMPKPTVQLGGVKIPKKPTPSSARRGRGRRW